MGLIYLATSPSGKCYVGQTTKPTVAARWCEHVSEANGTRDNSWLLNRAIRKHGGDKFALMLLWECADDGLDEWEIYFIELFDAQAPAGYNLSKGGKNGFKYTPEVRSKMSNSQRRNHYKDQPMPAYMYYYPGKGFGIRPPGKRITYFRDMGTPMELKYARALEALSHPEDLPDYTPQPKAPTTKKPRVEWNLGKPRQSFESADLPRYVTYLEPTDVIKVQKPGKPVRTFGNKKLPFEERKRLAIEYLNSIS